MAGLCRTLASQKRHSCLPLQIKTVGSLDTDSFPEYCAANLLIKVGNWLPTSPIQFAPSRFCAAGFGIVRERHTWRPALATRLCTRILLVLTLSLLFFSIPPVNAGSDDWLPIDSADLKMTSEPLAPGAPAIYLYRQVDRDDKGRASTEYNYLRIKILTEEGRKYANIEVPFNKQGYNVSRIRARTIRPDGSIVNFDGKIFESTIVKSKTLKYLAKTFSMPDVSVGSIIEYRFNYDFHDYSIFNSHWILSEELFTKLAKFSLKPYEGPGFSVQWVYPAGLPAGTVPAKDGPDKVIRLEAKNIPAFQIEDYMPPENELKFRVTFIYREGNPEMNVDKYWADFNKKQNSRVEDYINKRKAMEQAAAQIVSPSDAPLVKLQKIYTRTQQIRNLSYEESKTEQEEKREKLKSDSNVEALWKNQYGYGSDITWLFLALARAAGFDAHACWVSGRNDYFFRRERLNSAELDANVVLVKLDGKDLYLDPGAEFIPFGLLPWMETGVVGMQLDKEGGKWISTPLPPSDASLTERKADLKLLDDGSLEGKLIITWTGLSASWRRVNQRNEDAASRKKFLEDDVKESITFGSELELSNQPNWKTSEVPLVAEFTLKIPGFASSAGRKALLPASIFSATEKHMFEHSERVHAVYFEYPYRKIDDVTVDLPLGWKATTLPKPIDQDVKAAEYKLNVEDQKGLLHIRRELRSDVMMVPKDMYPALRSFYQAVRTQDDQQIVLQPGGASASQ